jgi:hypothetical protein
MEDHDVNNDWQLINKHTGEIRDIVLFDSGKRERWDKVYARSLADVLELAGDEKTRVLALMLRKKDQQNRILMTVREMAAECDVSKTTVSNLLILLQKHNHIHKIKNGQYRFSPHIIQPGKSWQGAAVYRSWQDENKKAD